MVQSSSIVDLSASQLQLHLVSPYSFPSVPALLNTIEYQAGSTVTLPSSSMCVSVGSGSGSPAALSASFIANTASDGNTDWALQVQSLSLTPMSLAGISAFNDIPDTAFVGTGGYAPFQYRLSSTLRGITFRQVSGVAILSGVPLVAGSFQVIVTDACGNSASSNIITVSAARKKGFSIGAPLIISDDGLSGGAIAGIVIGSLVGLAILVVIIVVVFKALQSKVD